MVQLCQQGSIDDLAVSVDAEKALIRVEWLYLLYIMEFDLCHYFINWLKFAIIPHWWQFKWTHIWQFLRSEEGCPFSPLLFTLVIKPLAEVVCYTDDMLLFVSNSVKAACPHTIKWSSAGLYILA